MASLIEDLILTMKKEDEIYKELIPIEDEKTQVIIKNDLESLQKITEKEQSVIEKINALEKKRDEIIINMGTVLNRNPSTLSIKTLIKLMAGQPDVVERLSVVYDSLTATVKRLVTVNDRNKILINESLEMIDFNMNLLQSMQSAPELSNYNTRGASQNISQTYRRGSFDAKQ